jgi:hypothetical protein
VIAMQKHLKRAFGFTLSAFAMLPVLMFISIGEGYSSITGEVRRVGTPDLAVLLPSGIALMLLAISIILELGLWRFASSWRRVGLSTLILLQLAVAGFVGFVFHLGLTK